MRKAVLLIMSLFLAVNSVQAYSGGSGTEADPYQVATAEDLIQLGETTDDYGKHFIMKADIDLTGQVFSRSLIASEVVSDSNKIFDGVKFTGHFDGNYHIVNNLTVSGLYHCGLFGYIGSDGVVTNLGLINVTIDGIDGYIGGLCGRNNGTIEGCYASGVVREIGTNISSSCSVGGLCGSNSGIITRSYASCSVSGIGINGTVGGLCGNNSGTITSSYTVGAVSGDRFVGGLCGKNSGSITGCYASGPVSSARMETYGICGYQVGNSAIIENCFWDTETSGQVFGYYVSNQNPGTIINVSGKTTSQMQTLSTFVDVGWDFSSDDGDVADWQMLPNNHPFLAWENPLLIAVPDISGLTQEQAQAALENLGLGSHLSYKYSDAVSSGLVFEQIPASDEQVAYGRVVRVAISLGLSPFAGSGTTADPYQIATVDDLLLLNDPIYCDYFASYILTADIDLAGQVFSEALIASDTDTDFGFQGTYFNGHFDGNGHVISNLTIDGYYYCGLFGYVGPSGEVANIGLENVSIIGKSTMGGLCGKNSGTLTSSYSSGSVSGSGILGGLCGNNQGTICSSYSSCSVDGNVSIGGLCGVNYGAISFSFASGLVSGDSSVGGFCGFNQTGTVESCFWDLETSGSDNSAGGWGLDSVEMKLASSYIGWKNSQWTISNGNDYPHLAWENAGGVTINTDYPTATYEGLGTEQSPFELDSAEDLLSLMYRVCDWDKCITLTDDIDLSGYNIKGSVVGYGVSFKGKFDGNGHTISNLSVRGLSSCGFFGSIGSDGVVANLGIKNIDIFGRDSVGGLCGFNYGTITDSYAKGSFGGKFSVGGLCGSNSGTLSGSHSDGSVFGSESYATFIGGLCGDNRGSVVNCYSKASATGSGGIGGLCGENWSGTIVDSYANGSASGDYAGGLCGRNYSTISGCYATGSVSGGYYLGGLCGSNDSGVVFNSYATGSVIKSVNYGDDIGGFCGFNNFGTINSCYSTGFVEGGSHRGGFCGFNRGMITNCFWNSETSHFGYSGSINSGAIGKNSQEMKTPDTFTDAGWDFSTDDGDAADWQIRSGYDFPILIWQNVVPGDIAGSWSVDIADLEVLAAEWLSQGSQADFDNNSIVDMADFSFLANNWLKEPYWTDSYSLIAHWPLNETSGAIANDVSEHNNPGTVFGNPVYGSGIKGGCYTFDGVDDYIVSEGCQGVAGSSHRTVSAYIKAPASALGSFRTIVSWGISTTDVKWLVGLDNATGQLALATYGARVKGGPNLMDGQWHHIAVVLPFGVTNVNQVKLVVDGVEVNTNAPLLDALINTSLSDVTIGANNSSAQAGQYIPSSLFLGAIDDVRIYDVGIEPYQIAKMHGYEYYYEGDFIGHWKLDENSGTTAFDSSGYIHNAQVYGNPERGTGKVGDCYTFKSSKDYVALPHNVSLNYTQFTVCLWAKGGGASQYLMGPDISSLVWLGIDENNRVWTKLRPSGGNTLSSNVTWDTTSWHHLALVWDGSRRSIYLDGVLVAEDAADLEGYLDLTYQPIFIGSRNYPSPFNFWHGSIDDVRIYKKALEPAEIAELANMGN